MKAEAEVGVLEEVVQDASLLPDGTTRRWAHKYLEEDSQRVITVAGY